MVRRMMWVVWLAVLVALAGCGAPYAAGYGPMGAVGIGTPGPGGYEVADAEATLAMAQAVVNTQQAAEWEAESQATDVARVTEGAAVREIELIHARETADQHAFDLQVGAAKLTEAYSQARVMETAAAVQMTQAAERQATSTQAAAVLATQAAAPTATWIAGVATQQAQNDLVDHYAGLAWKVIWPVGLAALFGALVAGILYLAWTNRDAVRAWLQAMEMQKRIISDPALGRLVLERLGDGRMVVLDPSRLPGAAGVIGSEGIVVDGLGLDFQVMQAALGRAQAVDLVRAMPRVMDKKGAQAIMTMTPGSTLTPSPSPFEGRGGEEGAAPWEWFDRWGGDSIPLGMGADGKDVLAPDLEGEPHRLFAGMTGAGKSRNGMRPFVAGALGRGWQVVVIGDQAPVDFKVFDGRKNYFTVDLEAPEEAIGYLTALNGEIKRRIQKLYAEGVSLWGQLKGAAVEPRLVVAFDEFAALADGMESRDRERFFRLAANVSRLARKAGVHLLAGVQNPTADNIRPSIRRNMTPVAFRVVDAAASRAILEAPGAEALKPPQFLARLERGGILPGVGWNPSDSEIGGYIDDRGGWVVEWEAPGWLKTLTPGPSPDDGRGELDDEVVGKVLELHRLGMAPTAIGRQVFGYKGGQGYTLVKAILGGVTGDGVTEGAG